MKTAVLVIGGGLAGVVAALRARALGQDVVLVEKEHALGGLLGTYRPEGQGVEFDHGTHIPAETGEATLDQLLFKRVTSECWRTLPALQAATFWNGRLSTLSGCLDLRSLPSETYEAVVAELLTKRPEASFALLAQQIRSHYGPCAWERVFTPILRKFLGPIEERLAVDSHHLFGLTRFICLDAERTRELKGDPILDQKLAYHSFRDAPPGGRRARAFYPIEGGVGRWVEGLEEELRSSGARLLTGQSVAQIDPAGGWALTTEGIRIEFERLAWCLPPALLLRLCKHPAAVELRAPQFSAITLYHFTVDQPPVTDAHYVTCYDPALRTFRVTLYDNLQPNGRSSGRWTVEVLSPPGATAAPEAAEIFGELKQMGLLPGYARFLSTWRQSVPMGFPIQTADYRRDVARAVQITQEDYPNVALLGRATGQGFFMRDVLLDVWRCPALDPASAPVAVAG